LSPGLPARGFPEPLLLGRALLDGFRDPEPGRLSLLGRSDVTLDPLRHVLGT
jgi:hypothetical protein